jgi:hypothetical protein
VRVWHILFAANSYHTSRGNPNDLQEYTFEGGE